MNLFLFLILFASRAANAGEVHLYFGNGIFNSANDVNNSLVELKTLDLSSKPADQTIDYRVALNLDESKLYAVLTVVEQKADGNLSYFWNVMDGILPLPDWLVEPMEAVLSDSLDQETLDQMLSQYETDLEAGIKIILVSHSQGNFYAEESIQNLIRRHGNLNPHQMGFGNIRVATPAKTLFSFPYFTFSDDEVISWVRKTLGAPAPNLSSQGSGPGPYLDPLGHSFIQAYLTISESREKIRQAILEEIASTPFPSSVR